MDILDLTPYDIYICCDRTIIKELIENLDSLEQRILKKIKQYHKFIEQLKIILSNKVDIESLNNSITFNTIYEEYQRFMVDNTSRILLNNHLAILYPNIVYYKATKPVLCSFSGEIIKKDTEYIYYRPLLDDITCKKTYIVTPTIKCSTHYEQCLPKTILELETLNDKLLNSYDGVVEDIDYYDMSCNLKCDGFSLIHLKKH